MTIQLGARPRLTWRPDVHRDATILLGLIVGLAYAAGVFATPVDAVAYWNAGTSDQLYPTSWSEVAEGYLFYPPVVAQVSTLLQPIGWQAFIVALMVATFGAVWFCCREWSLPLLAIGIPYYVVGHPGPGGVLSAAATFLGYGLLGNLQWILAAAAVAAIRTPTVHPLLVLTKMTIAVGWWWHVVREEWRAAAIAAGLTLAIFGTSLAIAPDLWIEFAAFAARNLWMADPPIPLFPVPLALRLPMSIALVMWGARTNRAWTVPVAAGWAVPALYGLGFLPFWVAAAQLSRRSRRSCP